ncbi:uncharacterized protein LOC131171168 [Hevea brasiliensis]|uniref:uncharacterized protein LOC131171168 n=1 Tax=Hevea brasiliensis TaxID=3981 RepID=UPI0025FD0A53|nr:uncharacterized protein LOC131171168 [Hevea brasiliensis]
MDNSRALLATLKVRPVLVERVRETQSRDEQLNKIINEVRNDTRLDFSLSEDGTLMFDGRLCVPSVENLKREIMEEAHYSAYSMRLSSTKMYQDLRENYWWPGMKREIAEIVSRLTKSTHFLPVRMDYSLDNLAEIYVNEIVKLHGAPVSIVSDKDPSYHASLGMASCEALYRRRCRTPMRWTKGMERKLEGPEMV